jgi:C-terminal processing protease CtpA/Prc
MAYTADHKSFEGIGLAPDVVVKPTTAAMQASLNATDAPLERAIATLQK